jgi:hypothetical protein
MAELFGAHLDVTKNEIRKVAQGTVTAVYAARQTVDVQLAVNNPIFDEIGNVFTEPAPSLSDVPLGVMRGGGFFVWLPVNIGDSVLVLFSDLSTDTWRAGGGLPQDPGFVGKHTMDSAFAIPMVAPDANILIGPGVNPTKLVIGKDGSPAQILISATDIELGATAVDAVALASLVNIDFAALKTLLIALAAYATGIKPIADPTTAFTGTLLAALTTAEGALVPVGSTLIKAQ